MNIPANILHGRRDMPISELEIAPNRKGLDAVRQRFLASESDAFSQDERGRVSRFPGFSTMFTEEVRCSEKLPGQLYEFDLKGLGLLNGRDKWIDGPQSQPAQGWDTQSLTVYTRNPAAFAAGLVHPEISTLWVEDTERRREIGDIYSVDLSFKGMIPVDGQPKPYKRTIGVNSATMATSEPLQAWVKQLSGSYVLDTTGRYYNMEAPRVQVVDSFLSLTPPPTGSVPSEWTPPDAPAVRAVLASMTDGDPVVPANFLGVTEFTINVHKNWVLKSLSSEKHAYADVWLTSLTMEFIRPSEPRI